MNGREDGEEALLVPEAVELHRRMGLDDVLGDVHVEAEACDQEAQCNHLERPHLSDKALALPPSHQPKTMSAERRKQGSSTLGWLRFTNMTHTHTPNT